MGVITTIRSVYRTTNFLLKLVLSILILVLPLSGLMGNNTLLRRSAVAYSAEQSPEGGITPMEARGQKAEARFSKRIDYAVLPSQTPDEAEITAIGFIYYNGIPVADATVTIIGPSAMLTTTTQTGPLYEDPYFTASLSAPPLNAFPDDLLKMRFSYSDQENIAAFRVVAGEHGIHWGGANSDGAKVASGIYFMKLENERSSLVKKMVISR